ncbi:MAG: EamA/RhaT family transporter, partial [Alphaproteobacteria bacterium]|nr:EamA/RhaT family transporter [Alphaproteobacteria bacterium]
MLWILLTVAATPLQVARNALQRALIAEAGAWGATLVRFLFGLPFSIAIFAVVALLTPGAALHLTQRFFFAVASGAVSQMAATAALLVAMRRSGFAVATVLQQSSLPFAAIFGWVWLGDALGARAWTGVVLTTLGLAILSWPRRDQMKGAGAGALLGLASGAAFAVALNAFRDAAHALDAAHPIYAATASVCVAQAIQTAILATALAAFRPAALIAIARGWRASVGAGFFGAAASAFWFGALALAPAGPVRAVGVIE